MSTLLTRTLLNGAKIEAMPRARSYSAKPRWSLIPVRVLLVTFLLTLLTFAVSLLGGILGLVIAGKLKGFHPNMAVAYRHIALPVAAAAAAIVLISATVMEVRNYRQAKALVEIERASR